MLARNKNTSSQEGTDDRLQVSLYEAGQLELREAWHQRYRAFYWIQLAGRFSASGHARLNAVAGPPVADGTGRFAKVISRRRSGRRG